MKYRTKKEELPRPQRCDCCGLFNGSDLSFIQLGPDRYQWLCENCEDAYYWNLEHS